MVSSNASHVSEQEYGAEIVQSSKTFQPRLLNADGRKARSV
jgi:hypothetical protein